MIIKYLQVVHQNAWIIGMLGKKSASKWEVLQFEEEYLKQYSSKWLTVWVVKRHFPIQQNL